MYVSLFEIDTKKSFTVSILVIGIMAIAVVLLLGCAFHCKAARKRAIHELKNKLAKLMKKKELLKPI